MSMALIRLRHVLGKYSDITRHTTCLTEKQLKTLSKRRFFMAMRTAFSNDPDLRRTVSQLSMGGPQKVTYQSKFVTVPVTAQASLENSISKMVTDWKKEVRHTFTVPSAI
jgi:hypothetical protein